MVLGELKEAHFADHIPAPLQYARPLLPPLSLLFGGFEEEAGRASGVLLADRFERVIPRTGFIEIF